MLLSHSHESSGRPSFKRVEQFYWMFLSFPALGVFKVCVHQCKKQVFATILHLLTSCLTLFTEAIMLEFVLEFQLICQFVIEERC